MRVLARFQRSPFLRNVTILASGTVLAQAILILASPVLTRLYSPAAFGMLAVFLTAVSSLTLCVTGKYEAALVLPKRHNIAVELYGVAVWFGIVISLCSALTLLFLQDPILEWLEAPKLRGWILLSPAVLFVTGIYNLSGYFANRHRRYGLMARAKVTQAVVAVSITLLLGFLQVGFLGLLLGNIAGLVVSTAYFVFKLCPALRGFRLDWSRRKHALARRYAEFPIYNASTGLLNGFTYNLPTIILAHHFSAEAVGFFALLVRVMNAPLGMVSAAVSQVNLKKVVDLVHSGHRVEPYLLRAACSLALVAGVPAMILLIWGPSLFHLVFGDKWQEAGHYAQILAWSLVIKFVASTLSPTLEATKNNRYGALWKVISFTSTLLVLSIVATTGTVQDTLTALVINEIAIYTLYLFLILRAARKPKNFPRRDKDTPLQPPAPLSGEADG